MGHRLRPAAVQVNYRNPGRECQKAAISIRHTLLRTARRPQPSGKCQSTFDAQLFTGVVKDTLAVSPLLKYWLKLAASKVEPEFTNRTGLSSRLPADEHLYVSPRTATYCQSHEFQ